MQLLLNCMQNTSRSCISLKHTPIHTKCTFLCIYVQFFFTIINLTCWLTSESHKQFFRYFSVLSRTFAMFLLWFTVLAINIQYFYSGILVAFIKVNTFWFLFWLFLRFIRRLRTFIQFAKPNDQFSWRKFLCKSFSIGFYFDVFFVSNCKCWLDQQRKTKLFDAKKTKSK